MVQIYETLLRLAREGQAAVLVTVAEVQGAGPAVFGGKRVVPGRGEPLGTVGGGALERMAVDRAREILASGSGGLQTFDVGGGEGTATGMVCGGRVTLLFEPVRAAERLTLYGAGHIGQALCRHVAGTMTVTVVDQRPRLLEQVEAAQTRRSQDEVTGDRYVVIATSSHEQDYRILAGIMAAAVRPMYVGLVASRRKRALFLERLARDGGTSVDRDVLYCPAGLDIGGGSPEDIAVAIAAEIQAVRNRRQGLGHLDEHHNPR